MHNALNSQSGQLQDLSNDMTELKSMVSEQTGELRSWMRAQLEAAINAKLLGARPNMVSESAESNPATPPDAPDQDQEDTMGSADPETHGASRAMLARKPHRGLGLNSRTVG